MSKNMLITICVAGPKFAAFMAEMSGALAHVDSFEAVTVEEGKGKRQHGPSPQRQGRVPEIVLTLMQTEPVGHAWPIATVGAHLESKGFAAASASPALSGLVKSGDAIRTERNVYALAPKKDEQP